MGDWTVKLKKHWCLCVFCNVNSYQTEEVELNIVLLENTTNKGHNSTKKHSIIKPVCKQQELDVLINPVTFHSNCISSIKKQSVQT